MTASSSSVDAIGVALQVAAAIEAAGGSYFVGGSLARFSRRRPVSVRSSGETLILKSPEDTVLRKLLWHRAGGEVSDRQ